MTKRALIIVDVQNDFCEGGSLAVQGGGRVASEVTLYGNRHFNDYRTVVATKDWHFDPGDHFAPEGQDPDYVDNWPHHCEAGSEGAKFHPAFDSSLPDLIFYKGQTSAAYSGFEGKDDDQEFTLDDYLKQLEVTEVDVVGIAFDYCVKATAIDAANLGYLTTVLKPLTASVNPDNDAAVTADLLAAGANVADEI